MYIYKHTQQRNILFRRLLSNEIHTRHTQIHIQTIQEPALEHAYIQYVGQIVNDRD